MNGDGNFKMKCVDTSRNKYTEGKIYEVKNGKWFNDLSVVVGNSDIKNIDDVNRISYANGN